MSYDSKYDEPWGTEQCNNYLHVYPVEWNKKKVEESYIILGPNANNALDNMYAERIQNSCNTGDNERDHGEADEILCNLLKELGFHKVVEAYEDVDKWYA